MTNLRQSGNFDKILERIEKKINLHRKRAGESNHHLGDAQEERETGRAEGLMIAKGIIEEMKEDEK